MSLNKVMLIGNVGRDPEIRYTDQNSSNKVATFTLATTEKYRDRVTNELRESTEWHNIVAWRNNADLAEKYIRKGSQIFIEGSLRTRQWNDQSGNKRYTTEVVASTIQLLGRKSEGVGAPAAASAYSQPAPAAAPAYSQTAPAYSQTAPTAAPAYSQPAPAAPVAPAQPEDDLPF